MAAVRTIGGAARARRVVVVVLLAAVTLAVWCGAAIANETVEVCGTSYLDHLFGAGGDNAAISATHACPQAQVTDPGMSITASGTSSQGQRAYLQANAPWGLAIVGAQAREVFVAGVNSSGSSYGGGFYWQGGGAEVTQASNPGPIGVTFAPSSYFGWQLVCGAATCNETFPSFNIGAMSVYVQETVGPSLAAPSGLWQTSGWVRGSWPFVASADSPSGVCTLQASLNGEAIGSTSSQPDVSQWHQCSAPALQQTVDTGRYGEGQLSLQLTAFDAAGVPAVESKTVYVDNQQPTISLTGPTDAPSTAGTQYVTATATAGPSGVAGITCSVDNAPPQSYPRATAQVPVSGLGVHQIQCYAQNNALDVHGYRNVSPLASYQVKIGDPTISGISFNRIVNALRCRKVKQRVKVPTRWVTVRRHHQRVRIKRRAHTKVVKVTRCHPRTKIERVTVRVRIRRHGKKVWVKRAKRERVVLTPRVVGSMHRRVGHGKATTVSGWLGTYTGVALPGQPVEVYTAPDNGLGHFTPATGTTTAADGSWTVQVPAGPSRLIEAAYGGGAITEPSVSAQVRLTVPAKVKLLKIAPGHVAWGHTIRLTGQLKGGYLPHAGENVRLRIGEGRDFTTYGVHVHVHGKGRVTTTYRFGAGDPSIHRTYWFQLATLPQGDYPYAPANSGKLLVHVGGHPKPPATHHRRHRKRPPRRH